jgi:hypothetical protein
MQGKPPYELQWLNSYFSFARLLIIFVPKSYILVIYTLYSMITYGDLVGVPS